MKFGQTLQADGTSAAAQDAAPLARLARDTDGTVLFLSGDWLTRTAGAADAMMRAHGQALSGQAVTIDVSAVTAMDTAGAWLIERLRAAVEAGGGAAPVRGSDRNHDILFHAVGEAVKAGAAPQPGRERYGLMAFPAWIGKLVYRFADQFILAMHILGATIRGAQLKFGRGHGLSPAAIVSQMDRMGVGAVPVVMLMSGIVGAIIAQQGAFQLRYFGAEIFVVDLVSILVLREIGVLMTAIMVAGRSGSAITAEIGSMKMREEVDALTVIGLNPVGVLVFPRLVALVIVLPCLTVAANAAALGGAILTAWFYSGISPEAFIQRMHVGIDLSTIFSGLIKAPFMAMIIGVIAAMEGLRVQGSAESLGRQVTASVVKAIFCVIVVDGLFAMFYAAIDY
ncbi:MAG: ABC transporter permease [Notoacmeibacter sp.]|nr:ABC transporter permease [Notoacmeibacter sp.]MCC0032994.1 ABC transporter permease [Brucellaceae bacterium]